MAGFLNGILRAPGALWNRGCIGKIIVAFLALIVIGICGAPFAGRQGAQPVTAPATVVAPSMPAPTSVPIEAPRATEVLATLATDVPPLVPVATPAPQPTSAPIAPANVGVAPQGSDCPADHPIKGNIRDRNPNKGEKIYHVPGDNGYAQTKPEQCFATAAAAEAAGYRPVQK